MIDRAVELLRAGRLVAFATETVYGLGADATNAAAVARIFAAKGRPNTNPLIVHVHSVEVAKRYVSHWPDFAQCLAERFWPGPLTIVLPKNQSVTPSKRPPPRPSPRVPRQGECSIVDLVTAGLSTVGIRIPNHPVAVELLRAFDGAVAAPSANKSNHVSPTTAQHVRDELGDAVDLILDGGPCAVGIESTVLDLSSSSPRILRPGGVTREEIEEVIGAVEAGTVVSKLTTPARSPGQQETHYAPRTPAFRYELAQRARIDLSDAAIIELTLDPATYARNFYARLRLLDTQQLRAIYIELPPDRPAWVAVRDRIIRATKPI